MSFALLLKLTGLIAVSFIGYLAARLGAFGTRQASPVLASAAFNVFGPALMFRATATMSIGSAPWHALLAFFVPALVWMIAVRWLWPRGRTAQPGTAATGAMTLTFGNSVQVGIPMAATFFGEAGLQMHVALVSVHALILLTTATFMVEAELARSHRSNGRLQSPWKTLAATARSALIHPVVLPVLLGFACNLLGLPLPAWVDNLLATMAQAFVPLCLVLIGVMLAELNLRGALGAACWLSVCKLLLMPLWVGGVAWFVFDLRGTPLAVVVMAAALPIGNNPVLFAQRYGALVPEATAAAMVSTVLYIGSAPLWLALLARL